VKSRQTPRSIYDGLYGSKTGPWTTDMFIEAAYKTSARSAKELLKKFEASLALLPRP